MAVVTPITCAWSLTKTPPEFPGVDGGVGLDHLGIEYVAPVPDRELPESTGSERERPLTIPSVIVPERPKGLPMAMASWPTLT